MGSRKISFEPAARMRGRAAVIAMNVSLCGPHSFDTSTFCPTMFDALTPALGSDPFFSRYWYLFHQLGLFGLLVVFWANPAVAITAKARIRKERFIGHSSHIKDVRERKSTT